MRARNRWYDRAGRRIRVDAPVISVGNLTVGGTGKTPLVAYLGEELARRGRVPGIVSRGYGGRAGKGPVDVSRGEGPLVDADVSGDEPALLARRLPGARIVVGSDRVAAARRALELGATALVLDDGFQHRRLARDLDLVLLDASNPFGSYLMLPAGRLREPIEGLARADVAIVTRAHRGDRFPIIERVVRNHNPDAPILTAGHRGLGFVRGSEPVDAPRRAVAFCAIGNPRRFRIDLEALGVEIVEFRAFRDHHRFREREWSALRARAAETGAALVTTEKDRARMEPDGPPEEPLVYRIEVDLHDPAPLGERLDRLVGASR